MGEFHQRRINPPEADKPYPLRILLAKLGAAVSPIDKLRKHSALPTVTSKKPILFFREPGFIYIAISYLSAVFFADQL